jgi:hypothetical protein
MSHQSSGQKTNLLLLEYLQKFWQAFTAQTSAVINDLQRSFKLANTFGHERATG